ncbi:MAG: enolase C-terminal domain-like protein [Gammaproteobacteria bacterium]
MNPIIENIRARAVAVPMKRPPAVASGAIAAATFVLIDMETDAGLTGCAYIFTFTESMLAPTVAVVEALGELLRGDQVVPLEIEAKLRSSFAIQDSHGIVGQAIAGLDMALWDAHAKVLGVPLVRALGGKVKPIRAYNSCGLWIQNPARLGDEAEALLEEGGFKALKLRLGRTDFDLDLAAVRNVKKRLGDDIPLMVDFNQSLTVSEGIRRGLALDDEGLYWIEEPVRHDDYAGHARISRAIKTPIQLGENLLSAADMQKAIEARAADFYMPDVQRIGGVTGWMRAAALAQANGLEMSSHLFPEFSAHLLAATPSCHWLEYMDWAAPILQEPFEVMQGCVVIPDRLGAGIAWNEDAVRQYRQT